MFTPDTCLLQGHTLKKDLLLGKEKRGLYYLNRHTELQTSLAWDSTHHNNKDTRIFQACFSAAELGHFRLGHLSFEQLQYVGLSNCNNAKQYGVLSDLSYGQIT